MNQSTTIIGFLVAGFFIFITVRGELPQYMGVIFGAGQGPKAPAQKAATPASGNDMTKVSDAAATIGKMALMFA